MSGSTTVFPSANYSGATTSASVAIDDVSTLITFSIDRSSGTLWSQAGTQAAIEVDVSLDGGTTWIFLFAITVLQRNTGDPKDNVTNAGTATTNLPAGTGRKARAIMTVTSGQVHTSGTLSWQ